ncbi:MAG: choice-of-anchor D domain-containing protein, partial [Nitrospirota bacterium]
MLSLGACATQPAGPDQPQSQAKIKVMPGALDFKDVEVGQTYTKDVFVSNSGNTALTVKGIFVEGAGFSKQSDTCLKKKIGPDGSCSITVAFSPDLPGRKFSGTLSIFSHEPDSQLVEVALKGTGHLSPNPDIKVTSSRIDFGTKDAGSKFSRDITINNVGNKALVIYGASIKGQGFSKQTDKC